MKKTIILSPHNPFLRSNGGENRIYSLIKEKSKQGEIILICPKGKTIKLKNVRVYQIFKDNFKQKTLNFSLMKELRCIINKEPPSEIQLEFPWQGINLMILGRRYTFDDHNVEFLRFKRTGSWLWPLIYVYELIICKFADKIICVSDTDKSYLSKYFFINPNKVEVIENPVDKSIFFPNNKNNQRIKKELGLKDEKMILFFGQLDYKPNVEALEIIKAEILPKLEESSKKYKLVICGKGNGNGLLINFKHQNLIFKGFVDRIQDYINASDVVIAPLKSGSGTRIKILEALACKKRVISTSIGAEGIKKNKLLEIEDDWERFVEKI